MRRIFGLVVVLLLSVSLAQAEEFSLYGIRFGMTRAELKGVWTELQSGQYHIKDALVFDIHPEFDSIDRLYKVKFSVPLPDKYPFQLVAAAYQNLVNRLWGQQPELIVSVAAGRSSIETTVTHKRILEEYTRVIETELSGFLRK